jgi:sugar/nucleoside kinase (ribokinase family)
LTSLSINIKEYLTLEKRIYPMSDNQIYDVVCIGNYTKDTIITPTGTEYVDGGAVNYSAHAAVRLGAKVAVVTRLAQKDSRVIEAFAVAGIDCFPTFTSYSTHMKLEYPTTNPDIRKLSVTHTAGAITPSDLSSIKGMKSAVIGTSFRGEVGIDVIEVLRQKEVFLAADVQGFVRVLDGENLKMESWKEMEETLALLDVLKADAIEAEYLTGESDIYKAAQIFSDMGPKEIVLTHKDGLLIYADNQFYTLKFYPQQTNGRSGRGDTCLGSYTVLRLSKSPEEASIWAAALTSLKMEKQGPFHRDIHEVEDLIERKYR